MEEGRRLSLSTISAGRLPGVSISPGGEVLPLYTAAVLSPEVTHYLISALDDAIELLQRARVTAPSQLKVDIDNYIGRV